MFFRSDVGFIRYVLQFVISDTSTNTQLSLSISLIKCLGIVCPERFGDGVCRVGRPTPVTEAFPADNY